MQIFNLEAANVTISASEIDSRPELTIYNDETPVEFQVDLGLGEWAIFQRLAFHTSKGSQGALYTRVNGCRQCDTIRAFIETIEQ